MTADRQAALDQMVACFEAAPAIYHPSAFWTRYNRVNRQQLTVSGYDHFKRTVSTNYFTWVTGVRNPQFWFLAKRAPLRRWAVVLRGLFDPPVSDQLSRSTAMQFRMLTQLLWLYAVEQDPAGLLAKTDEPRLGDPFSIYLDGRLISQDLANSFLEYTTMAERVAFRDGLTVCELGAGSGRVGYWLLRHHPGLRYIIVDIPPALDLAEWYLTRCFPDLRTWRFRPVLDIGPFQHDIAASQLVFLLPHQAAQLPAGSVDLFINISSLQEMRPEQIDMYLTFIDRLTSGHVYLKQWKISHNPDDGVLIRQSDYPIPGRWRLCFSRTAPVQTAFFEALYAV
jgi:putative sugar O-methyltransferase